MDHLIQQENILPSSKQPDNFLSLSNHENKNYIFRFSIFRVFTWHVGQNRLRRTSHEAVADLSTVHFVFGVIFNPYRRPETFEPGRSLKLFNTMTN